MSLLTGATRRLHLELALISAPGQDPTGAKLWTEEVPGFLEVAGPQAVMPRVTDRWMDREASKEFSRPGDQKRGVGCGGGAQEESLEALGEVSLFPRYLRGLQSSTGLSK